MTTSGENLMKKSLLALAVLGAFAGAANAQSNVTVYGVVDLSVGRYDEGLDGNKWQMKSGRNAASRIGFKGSEDLGGGLKATFNLESGFNSDDGTINGTDTELATGESFSTQIFERAAWVGLEGGFGAVRLGQQNVAFKDSFDSIDPFGGAGDLALVDVFGTPERQSNVIRYNSPSFGGFKAAASYTMGEASGAGTSASDAAQLSLGLGYANGPLNVQGGYHKANDAAGADLDATFTFVGATYDFGVVKAHALLNNVKEDTAGGDETTRGYMIGATVPFGASKIMAFYAKSDARDLEDEDSAQLSLAYVYSLSKRTSVYAQYARTTNDDLATLGVDDTAAGENGSRVMVGVRHNF
jgi:predicted porin